MERPNLAGAQAAIETKCGGDVRVQPCGPSLGDREQLLLFLGSQRAPNAEVDLSEHLNSLPLNEIRHLKPYSVRPGANLTQYQAKQAKSHEVFGTLSNTLRRVGKQYATREE